MTIEPLCRDAEDPTRPCQFWKVCHESRRRLQHYNEIRGQACWAFQMHSARPAAEPEAIERAAIQEEARA